MWVIHERSIEYEWFADRVNWQKMLEPWKDVSVDWRERKAIAALYMNDGESGGHLVRSHSCEKMC